MRSLVLALVPTLGLLAVATSAHADPTPAEASSGPSDGTAAVPGDRTSAPSDDASDADLDEDVATSGDEADAARDDGDPATGDDEPHASDDDTDVSDDADSAHDDAGSARRRRTFRWSDGPRRVPTPRGRSAERAAELGLGTRECASRLLHGEPDATWCAAARGDAPERLLWPVDDGGWVRGFGYVRTTRPDLIHRGVDIAAPVGTVVRAAADGIVAYADNGVRGYGNLVMIVHANGWMTLYAHNSRVTVQPGYRVSRGERIALVGATGIAHGPHVHFELWQAGHAVDPAALFDGGPAFVERIAERAAARGEVPPPCEVTEADRPDEAPLSPHPDDAAAAGAATPSETRPRTSGEASASHRSADSSDGAESSAAAAGSASAARDTGRAADDRDPSAEGDTAPAGPVLGTNALARHLLAHPAPDALLAAVEGRTFTTLLFPVRGGRITRAHSSSRRPMEISGDEGTAIRAAADGLVVFADTLAGHGDTVVVLHENGWATFYERITLVSDVTVGTSVARGAWIGRATSRAMRFELRIGGVVRDPADVLVDPRASPSE